jgi:hypothetical protein
VPERTRSSGSARWRRCRSAGARISSRSTRSSSAPTPTAGMFSPTGCCARAGPARDAVPGLRHHAGRDSPRWCRGAVHAPRARFSTLSYAGSKKISRMPPRSAIVGFSVEKVYAIAELLRRQKGGAAVVMGALSPRTRNAQVELYQNGDVDASGGDRRHRHGAEPRHQARRVFGAGKFDGRRMRDLTPHELAQIAGRAGRHTSRRHLRRDRGGAAAGRGRGRGDQEHRFAPCSKLQWRNSDLEFGAVDRLIASLEERPEDDWLNAVRARGRRPHGAQGAGGAGARSATRDRRRPRRAAALGCLPHPRFPRHQPCRACGAARPHLRLPARHGRVYPTIGSRQVKRIDRTDGDIDTLSKRLAYIRTWTYVAQRGAGWRTKAIGASDPCGRRPPVGRAAWRADPEICRPAHQRASAPVETEGEPCGRGDERER